MRPGEDPSDPLPLLDPSRDSAFPDYICKLSDAPGFMIIPKPDTMGNAHMGVK